MPGKKIKYSIGTNQYFINKVMCSCSLNIFFFHFSHYRNNKMNAVLNLLKA